MRIDSFYFCVKLQTIVMSFRLVPVLPVMMFECNFLKALSTIVFLKVAFQLNSFFCDQ